MKELLSRSRCCVSCGEILKCEQLSGWDFLKSTTKYLVIIPGMLQDIKKIYKTYQIPQSERFSLAGHLLAFEIPEFSDVSTLESLPGNRMAGLRLYYSLSNADWFFKKKDSNEGATFPKQLLCQLWRDTRMWATFRLRFLEINEKIGKCILKVRRIQNTRS